MEFEIKRTDSGWRTVRSHVVGQSSVSNRTKAPFRKTASRSSSGFAGPAAEHDIHFRLDARTGKWEFGAGGNLKTPYVETVSLGREEDPGGGRWRTETWEETHERKYYAHGSVRGEIPGERPGPLDGVAETEDSERNAGNFDYTTGRNSWEVSLSPVWPDVEVVVKIEGLGPEGEALAYEDWLPRGTPSGEAGARLKATSESKVVITSSVVVTDLTAAVRVSGPNCCPNPPRGASPYKSSVPGIVPPQSISM